MNNEYIIINKIALQKRIEELEKIDKKGWRTEPHYIHDRGFNSPTEAYESAIEYTLNNLI